MTDTDLVAHIRDGGEVRTRDGRPVRVLSTEGHADFPIVGLAGDDAQSLCWAANGTTLGRVPRYDIIPAPRKHTRYLNVYSNGTAVVHGCRQEADEVAGFDRVACIRVEYTEGQFDD